MDCSLNAQSESRHAGNVDLCIAALTLKERQAIYYRAFYPLFRCSEILS